MTFIPNKYEDNIVEVVFNTTTIEKKNLNPDEGVSSETEKDGSGFINPDFVDSFSNSFKKFLWPTRFIEREISMKDVIMVVQKILDKVFCHLPFYVSENFHSMFGIDSPSVTGVTEAVKQEILAICIQIAMQIFS